MSTMRRHGLTILTMLVAGGWFVALGLALFWSVQPANLPTVTQPLPVLNPQQRVAVGERLLLEVQVVKTVPRDAEASDRWLICENALVPLTSEPTTVPVTGEEGQTFTSSSIVIPATTPPGRCQVNWSIKYHINPIRDERLSLQSEPFTVVAPDAVIGVPWEDVR